MHQGTPEENKTNARAVADFNWKFSRETEGRREPGKGLWIEKGGEDRDKGVQTWIRVGGPAVRPVPEDDSGGQGETGFQIVTHASGGGKVGTGIILFWKKGGH